MQVLGIATGGDDAERVVDPVADRLRERGRVAVVRQSDGTVAVDADGWEAAGSALAFDEVMDRLARDHDYGLVVDVPDARFPHVAAAGVEAHDPVVRFEDELPVAAAVEAIEDAEPFETLGSLVDAIKRSDRADYAGAIATFTGRVRALEDEDDEFTTSLTFEKYEGVAEERMREIETELEARDGVERVLLHHRTGRIDAGEDIVFVVVLAGHRREAFATVEDGIDLLKEQVPIFKKEVTTGEEFWVHERE
ncbi:MAG: molybdopterin synthase [Halanaeroarchaeum sp.]